MKKNWQFQLIIIIACFFIYFPTIYFDFSPLDEKWLITDRLSWLKKFSNIFSVFSSSDLYIYYRPILSLSFFTDVYIANGKPWIFHLTNILLHVANCLILFELLKSFIKSNSKALVFTLIFLFHPLCVHAIAWIPGRNDSILSIFVLSHLCFLLKYLYSNERKYLLLSSFSFLFSLFTKETAIMVPFISITILLLYKWDEKRKTLVRGSLIILLPLLIYLLLRENSVTASSNTTSLNMIENLPNSFFAMILYFGKAIIPIGQSVLPTVADSNLLIPLLGITLFILLCWQLGVVSKKIFTIGVMMAFCISILPVLFSSTGFYKEHYEHRFYLPLAGLIIAISQINFEKINTKYSFALFYSVLFLFAAKSFVRCSVYRNAETFAKAGIIESPNTELFHTIMGGVYMKKELYEKAIEEYSIASSLRPGKADIYNNRGYAFAALKQYKNSIRDFSSAIKLDSTTTGAFTNRAMAYYALQKFDSSKIDVVTAIRFGQVVDKRFIRDLLNAKK